MATQENPTIVSNLDLGRNNRDLKASAEALKKNGAWRKQRIVYTIPCGDALPTNVVVSMMSLMWPVNQPKVNLWMQNYEVGVAYEQAVNQILGDANLSQFDYWVTQEHDNIAEPNTVIRLLRTLEEHPELSAVSGLYYTKGEILQNEKTGEWEGTGYAQIWGDRNDPEPNTRPQPPDPAGGVVECWAIGMGMAIWRLDMFRELRARGVPTPWFKTVNAEKGEMFAQNESWSQDHYFWLQVAQPNGFRCGVDCSVPVGHYDSKTRITW